MLSSPALKALRMLSRPVLGLNSMVVVFVLTSLDLAKAVQMY